jgi:acyl-coenzyme A synthetase/AMP-(fatty) acid ligase
LSECTCAATINPVEGKRTPGTVGLPLPGQEVAVLRDDGRIGCQGQGEVVVRGPNVIKVPQDVFVLDSLPKNQLSKIVKQLLSDLVSYKPNDAA